MDRVLPHQLLRSGLRKAAEDTPDGSIAAFCRSLRVLERSRVFSSGVLRVRVALVDSGPQQPFSMEPYQRPAEMLPLCCSSGATAMRRRSTASAIGTDRITRAVDVRIGTAGWSIPHASAFRFEAVGTHLRRYARRFRCPEINSSFYQPHAAATYAKWRDSTPHDFVPLPFGGQAFAGPRCKCHLVVVRDLGERVRHDANHNLKGHEPDNQQQRDCQIPTVRVRAHAVGVIADACL